MSQFCDGCHARRSRGSVGMLRYCKGCIAKLFGWQKDDCRLGNEVVIELTDDGVKTGRWAKWVPDRKRN